MLVTGALVIATTQILPQLLQDEFGYTATLAGLALSPGGAVTMVHDDHGRPSRIRSAAISDRGRRRDRVLSPWYT